jgi:hypothetical protein
VVAGGTNLGAPSSHPRRSAAASVSLLSIQVRNDVTVRQRICSPRTVSILTKTGAQARLALYSSDGVPSSLACWTPRMRLSRERHSSCRRRASIKLFPLFHAFSQCSHEHHTNCLEFPDQNSLCSILPFPHPLVLPLSRVPWIPRNVQRSTKAHICCVRVHYSVGWERSNWAFICLVARQFPPRLQVPYRLMTVLPPGPM